MILDLVAWVIRWTTGLRRPRCFEIPSHALVRHVPLLPFYAEKGEAENDDAHLSL